MTHYLFARTYLLHNQAINPQQLRQFTPKNNQRRDAAVSFWALGQRLIIPLFVGKKGECVMKMPFGWLRFRK